MDIKYDYLEKKSLAKEIEQYFFERGEYDYPSDGRIRWISETKNRSETVSRILSEIKEDPVYIESYLKDQIATAHEEDAERAKVLLEKLKGFIRKVIEVKFKSNQNGGDLFYCPKNKRVYERQPANVDGLVFWHTTSKWNGGYEADCPIRQGIIMRVLDYKNKVIFEEKLEGDIWNGGTSAKKKGLFSYELLRNIEEEVKRRYDLTDYKQWKNWLISFAKEHHFSGYTDNWLYCEAETKSSVSLKKFEFYDGPVFLYKERRIHKICEKKWDEYEIRRINDDIVLALCGFKFKEKQK